MEFNPDSLLTIPLEQFRLFGIALCHRLGCSKIDKRLAKALKRLEQSMGPPINDQMRRDALNAATSVYRELRSNHEEPTIEAAIACTLVCACNDVAATNLIGNFESALSRAESLGQAVMRQIEFALMKEIIASNGKSNEDG